MDLARQLHAVDFQLITPTGHLYLKDQYLGEIETGQLKYLAWDPNTAGETPKTIPKRPSLARVYFAFAIQDLADIRLRAKNHRKVRLSQALLLH